MLQHASVVKNFTSCIKILLLVTFGISIAQNYFSDTGSVKILGIELSQFYVHAEVRILPLVIISFFLINWLRRLMNLDRTYFFSDLLLCSLCLLDAATHVNGFYSQSFTIPGYGIAGFDKFMHFLEGVMLLPVFLPLIRDYLHKILTVEKDRLKQPTYIVTIALLSIYFIVWEIIELFVDRYSGTTLLASYQDTNEDLFFAYLGFILSVLVIETWFWLLRLIQTIKFAYLTKNFRYQLLG